MGKEMATNFNMLAWKIPWTEEPGRLQSRGAEKSWTGLSERACTRTCARTRTHTHTHTETESIDSKPQRWLRPCGQQSLHFVGLGCF